MRRVAALGVSVAELKANDDESSLPSDGNSAGKDGSKPPFCSSVFLQQAEKFGHRLSQIGSRLRHDVSSSWSPARVAQRIRWGAESLLSWIVAVSCLGVSGYYYIRTRYSFRSLLGRVRRVQPPLPPLVTTAASSGGAQRSAKDAIAHVPSLVERVVVALLEVERGNDEQAEDVARLETALPSGHVIRPDDQLVNWIRSSVQLRRAVSDLVQVLQHVPPAYSAHIISPHHLLCEQVLRIYPRLLELPRADALDSATFPFEISLIVPFYDAASTHPPSTPTPASAQRDATIRHALRSCFNPSAVQLILVHSRDDIVNTNNSTTAHALCDDHGTDLLSSWGETKCLLVPNRGRGPCLNAGARDSTGKILVFCHADTKLPMHWDVAILNAYRDNISGQKHNVLATAFSFGVDSVAADEGGGGLIPCVVPGLNAVVTTANLRCRWFSLPYGDQCISVPSNLFSQLGGFPDVPLMEDYELISCLRQRQEYSLTQSHKRNMREQRIVILPQQVRCCPRRWLRHGVPWVTITNSRLVRAYHRHQLTAHELYRRYYGDGIPDPISHTGPVKCTT